MLKLPPILPRRGALFFIYFLRLTLKLPPILPEEERRGVGVGKAPVGVASSAEPTPAVGLGVGGDVQSFWAGVPPPSPSRNLPPSG